MKNPVILTVDNDPINNEIIATILKEQFTVHAVSNGLDAVEYCCNHSVDLVLLDIVMPQPDGFETSKLLLDQDPDLPIIFVTAKHSYQAIYQALVEYHGWGYVEKPFEDTILLAHVISALHVKAKIKR